MKKIITSITCLLFILLSGCAATETAISKRNLDVQTKMSNTIFLDPAKDSEKTVYVQVKNTSDKQGFTVQTQLEEALQNKGYKITNNLKNSHYLVQANILQVGKVDPSAAEKALFDGFGSNVRSAALGVTVGALASGNTQSMLAGGLIGGVVGTVADSIIKDVTYSVITDLQISERNTSGTNINQEDKSVLKQGEGALNIQTSSNKSNWKRYQTRILSTAEKVNLDFNDAKLTLQEGLANVIAGVF